jgi:Zn-dependent protease with chaperone function
MKKFGWILIMFVLLVFTSCTTMGGQSDDEPDRDPEVEDEIYDRLEEVNPEAVPIFKKATQAMDSGNNLFSKQGFEQVLNLAPGFPDALRRLSHVELELEYYISALGHAEQAFENDPSFLNQAALAFALLYSEDVYRVEAALPLAREAAESLPDDGYVLSVFLLAGAANDDEIVVREAAEALIRVAPEAPLGHYFSGLMAARDGDWMKAEQELLLAQELGMPEEEIQVVLDDGVRSQATMQRWMYALGYTLAGWLVPLLFLYIAGELLSELTLKAAYREQPGEKFEVGTGERLLRSIYRVVIAVTSIFYYISIPFLIMVVLAVVGGIFYMVLGMGTLSIPVVPLVGVAAIYTLSVVIRSVFTRVKDTEPGRSLSQQEAPDMWALAMEVGERLETRSIDAIYVTPGTEIAVMEGGKLIDKLRGSGRRSLIVGLGGLPGMTVSQFKAILAHEYGHFSNRDTAGGNLAKLVNASINRMAKELAVTGQAGWYNPVWLFVNGFVRVFMRITRGASRLQEILADRYAAMAYGVRNYIASLKYLIHQSLVFRTQVTSEIQDALKQGRDLQNIYGLQDVQTGEVFEQLKEKEDEIMSKPTSPYDSHPALSERIALLEGIEVSGEEDDHEPVEDLLPTIRELQDEMTAVVQTNVFGRRMR